MLLFIIIVVLVSIAAGLAWFLIAHDHGEKEPVGALWIAAGFGFLGGIAAALLETALLPAKDLQPGAPLLAALAVFMGVGVIEEALKFIPLSLFLFPKRYFNEHTDGVIYFALAGLGFGLPENLLYSLAFGSAAGVGRVIMTPFFHAAITGMVGYYLAKAKLRGRRRRDAWPVLLLAMGLHGLYDFGLSSGQPVLALLSFVITISLSVSLFIFYAKATDLDRASGRSVVGINTYCRTCGFKNPKHQLHCTRCGNYA